MLLFFSVFAVLVVCGNALLMRNRIQPARLATALNTVPLELVGQLNPANKWEVKFIFEGEEKIVEVSEGDSILESAEKIFKGVDSSCRNGVCTTCAGKVSLLPAVDVMTV